MGMGIGMGMGWFWVCIRYHYIAALLSLGPGWVLHIVTQVPYSVFFSLMFFPLYISRPGAESMAFRKLVKWAWFAGALCLIVAFWLGVLETEQVSLCRTWHPLGILHFFWPLFFEHY